jgi:hypothetical protein
MKERQFFTNLAIEGSDQLPYLIEEGYVSFKSTEPASILNVQVTASTTTVQEYAVYTINFAPNVEIEA